MKKILILMTLLGGSLLFAEEINIYSFGEFASYPIKHDNYISGEDNYFSTNIGAGAEYKNLFVEANQEVDIMKVDSLAFLPYKEKYYITIGFTIGVIQIGYQHLCTHNVDIPTFTYINEYDKIYINFDTRRLK